MRSGGKGEKGGRRRIASATSASTAPAGSLVGSILGQALGDALGFVVEAQPPELARVYVDGWLR
ncbi:MAG TPA: hypothetical protein VF252_13810, partial [Gemmatimonadales bacterium]